ncbi:Glyoxalase-like domain-containing protein [Lentibacillus halodurans]|uniref:Glyoxalase-like domain-containing protein n=2 Tax=Lentibacillus halodurans TaxID=237679 RepID=A0A1I0Z6V5_9BACI|nr:Glyoxalase-like domain-containing protein [Lentibacillus halodurans]
MMFFSYERIDHVQLAAPVGSEDQAREFYRDLLGFAEIEKPEQLMKNGGVWFQSGNVHVHIGVEDAFVPAKKAHPAFSVKNIEMIKTYLAGKSVDYREDDQLPGANRFYLSDPFGNRLEFLEWE